MAWAHGKKTPGRDCVKSVCCKRSQSHHFGREKQFLGYEKDWKVIVRVLGRPEPIVNMIVSSL